MSEVFRSPEGYKMIENPARAAGVQTFSFAHSPEDSTAPVQLPDDVLNAVGVITKTTTQINSVQWYLTGNFIEPAQSQTFQIGIYDGSRNLVAQAPQRLLQNGDPAGGGAGNPAASLITETLTSPLTMDAGKLYYLAVLSGTRTGGAFGLFMYQLVQPLSQLSQQRWLVSGVGPTLPAQVTGATPGFGFSTVSQWMQGVWL